LDGEEWEVIEADANSGLVKYARLCEGDTEQEISLEELEEVTLDEASALRARESVEATALEVDALVRQDDEAVAVVEYSPDPDVRLIRNIWARKGVLERVRGVKFMWGLFAKNQELGDLMPIWKPLEARYSRNEAIALAVMIEVVTS
jgi:hypothetical protein